MIVFIVVLFHAKIATKQRLNEKYSQQALERNVVAPLRRRGK